MKTNTVAGATRRKSDSPESALRSSTHFPTDLGVWLDHSALLQATQSLAQQADIAALHPVVSDWTCKFQDPWRMLSLITYAYAIGLFEDRAIARMAATKPELRALFRSEVPTAEAVLHFRDRNRHAISSCLGRVILHVWCERHGRAPTTLHPVLIVDILCDARARVQRACAGSVACEQACLAS